MAAEIGRRLDRPGVSAILATMPGMLSRLGWRAYSLAMLALRPHGFFAALTRLDWYGGLLRAWADGLNLPAPARVLEVGCSSGALAGYLARQGHDVVGLDRSARAVRHARAGHATGISKPRFTLGDAHDLPFPDGCLAGC